MGFPRHEYWSGLPFPSPLGLIECVSAPNSPTRISLTAHEDIRFNPGVWEFGLGLSNTDIIWIETGMNCGSHGDERRRFHW